MAKIILLLLLVACGIPNPTSFGGYSILGTWERTDGHGEYIFFAPYRELDGHIRFYFDDQVFSGFWETRSRQTPSVRLQEMKIYDISLDGLRLKQNPQWFRFWLTHDQLVLGEVHLERMN